MTAKFRKQHLLRKSLFHQKKEEEILNKLRQIL